MLTLIKIMMLVSIMILTFLLFKKGSLNMFNLIKKLFGKISHHHDVPRKSEIMRGELDVIGHGEIHIDLPKRPKEILSTFGRHCEITPCNPRHFDYLKSFFCHFHRKNCLVIQWNVSNARKIIWEVRF
jgi:hypothetical protein